jgi:LuxR family quorum sensing-dependent transcriptional regulator
MTVQRSSMCAESLAYGQDVLAFVDGLDRVSSPERVMDAMQRVLCGFGFEFFCFSDFVRPNQKFEEVMWACRVPPEWLKLYLEKDYARDDPSIRMCKRTVNPFEWREAVYDPEREPRAAEVVQRTHDFGLSNAFLIPIPSPSGCLGNVWIGGYHAELNEQTKTAIHLMALYAFDRIRDLTAPSEREKPGLTAREREVLTWVASGKSAWEIGEILRISKRTVDEHAQTAYRKLGAGNRAHAVAIALRDGMIEL